jgi:hypothetical protein
MEINNNNVHLNLNNNALDKASVVDKNTANVPDIKESQNKQNAIDYMKKAAINVELSSKAMDILFGLDAKDISKENAQGQNDLINFLSGKGAKGNNLADIGYEGKPIAQLSQNEAKGLLSKDGFFGVDKTSQRVADFVLSFSGDDLEKLEKGREGIVQGFKEADKLFGGKLPEISRETQKQTLKLIDEKIAQLKDEDKSQANAQNARKAESQKAEVSLNAS